MVWALILQRYYISLVLPDSFGKTIVACQSNRLWQRIITRALVYYFLKSMYLVKLLSYKSLLNIKQVDLICGNLQPIFHDDQIKASIDI